MLVISASEISEMSEFLVQDGHCLKSLSHWEQTRADTIGTVPVPGLAIFSAKILIYFSNKIYGSNLTKQHSQNADCSLRK